MSDQDDKSMEVRDETKDSVLIYDVADSNIDYLTLALEALKHGKVYEGPDAWERYVKEVGR